MSRQMLRYSILMLGFITAGIHAVVFNLQGPDWLNSSYGPLGIITKVDEVLLIIALWLYKDK